MFDDVTFLEDGNIKVEIFDKKLGYTVEKIIDKKGKEIFRSNYTSISTFKYPYETKIDRNSKKIFGLIDKNGNILASCEANDIANINYIEEVDFKEKRYLFKQNEKIGVKRLDGNIIIPAIYDKIFLGKDNLYTVCIDKNIENSCGLCKKTYGFNLSLYRAGRCHTQDRKDRRPPFQCSGRYRVLYRCQST